MCAIVQCCWSEGSPQCQIFCFGIGSIQKKQKKNNDYNDYNDYSDYNDYNDYKDRDRDRDIGAI